MSLLTKMRGIAGSILLLTAVFVCSAVITKADAVNCCTVGGTELTGSGSGSLAGVLTITATQSGSNTIFTITMAPPTGGNYTAAAFVSNIYFNVTGTPGGTTTYTVANGGINPCSSCGAIDSSGLAVTVGNNNQGQGSFTGFDGHIDLPPPPGGAAALHAGESITFTVVGLTDVDLCNALNSGGFSVIAHIQGLGAQGAQSGWYTCTDCNTPVPEPASMLLLGTGLVGAVGVVRRRFRKSE